jgi:hypothetical protein
VPYCNSIQSTAGQTTMKRAAQSLQTVFLQATISLPLRNSPPRTSRACSHAPTAASAQTPPWSCLQEYTFTLTQADGARVQGFCRRFLPPAPRVGSKLRYPQVLCLVCEASWSTLFFKVRCAWCVRPPGQRCSSRWGLLCLVCEVSWSTLFFKVGAAVPGV